MSVWYLCPHLRPIVGLANRSRHAIVISFGKCRKAHGIAEKKNISCLQGATNEFFYFNRWLCTLMEYFDLILDRANRITQFLFNIGVIRVHWTVHMSHHIRIQSVLIQFESCLHLSDIVLFLGQLLPRKLPIYMPVLFGALDQCDIKSTKRPQRWTIDIFALKLYLVFTYRIIKCSLELEMPNMQVASTKWGKHHWHWTAWQSTHWYRTKAGK